MPVPSRNILKSRAYRYFDDEQEEFRRSAGALLPVRVLDCDLAITEGEDIAALNLHMSTVRPGGREHPLGDAPISSNETGTASRTARAEIPAVAVSLKKINTPPLACS